MQDEILRRDFNELNHNEKEQETDKSNNTEESTN